MLSITAEFTFDSAHRLPGYPGLCANIHGHTYRVIATMNALDNDRKKPFLIDFSIFKTVIKDHFIGPWDHKLILFEQDKLCMYFEHLPETKGGLVKLPFIPSAENMAEYMAVRLHNEFAELYRRTASKSKLRIEYEHFYIDANNHTPYFFEITVYETPTNRATFNTRELSE